MTSRADEQQDPHDRPPIHTRAAPPRPKRLSRRALAILCGAGALAIAAALAWSLGQSRSRDTQENVAVSAPRDAEALSDAPKDYGDLAERAAKDMLPPGPVEPEPGTEPLAVPRAPAHDPADAEKERQRQAQESARGSKLFTGSGNATSTPPIEEEATTGPSPLSVASPPSSAGPGTSKAIAAPAGPNALLAGSTIAAALVTGLSSDLPGQVIAQVTEDVFDSVSGRNRLIPQGARLIGTYDARVRFGQDRAMIVWNRLIYPDGRSIALDDMIATDGTGAAGVADRVDNHWGRMTKAGLIATLLGVGTEAANGGDNDAIADAIRDSSGQTIGRAGDRIVERELEIRQTISIRPGARVHVLVDRNLAF
ncbi:type IV secretion system protein VirB10 [Sphingopyxis sp. YR583]|uniref:TrbI/VirB10 family protein n=1 Tax=Sphingopyxis sp. YR583 TaxID=1881047 RepID=UPI0008A7A3E7|nr:TrbI/VirB10 family protein [Sphingopyxis sp. YR583]SEH15000.1 type IV secretion system protein VirB10 [Sphingopyxis sp. YR583]